MVIKLSGHVGPKPISAEGILSGETSDAVTHERGASEAVDGLSQNNSVILDSWTDLGTGLDVYSDPAFGAFAVRDPVPDGTASGPTDSGLTKFFDQYADEASASAEPSFARTSVLGQDDLNLHFETETDKVTSQVFDTNTALDVAAHSLPPQTVEPIWEQGIWGVIFGNKTMLDVYKPFGEILKRPIDTSTPAVDSELSLPSSSRARRMPEPGLSYSDVVKDKPDISWQEQREADLQSSVKFWMALVDRWDSNCSLVTSVLEFEDTGRTFTMFVHLFAGRSPVTVKKRGYSIMRICDYLESCDIFFPCRESRFYDFLCKEQSLGAPQSRMKGYMQAVNFVRHVMSVPELEPLAYSARCKGACLGEYLKERIQASPLRVSEPKRIHDFLYTCEDLWVRMFCGALLMSTYCRARWGDLMRSESVILDYDREGLLRYIEARTGRHKTMKAQLHRHQFLPMVSPCFGIDGRNCGTVWLEVRDALKVKWPPEGLVMPAPGLQGQVTGRPLETQECAAWLKKIVGFSEDPQVRRVSSHSLKLTFLSYAAKRGSGMPERLQLGYHTSSFQMGMVYSRDGAAASILVLERLIEEIFHGRFDPDDTRSGRIKNVDSACAPPGEKPVIEIKEEPEVIEVSESDSESDIESSSTSSEEPRPAVIKPAPVVQPTCAPDGHVMWQHQKLKTLHLMSVQNSRVFVCGRSAGALHRKLEKAPEFDTPLCSLCFSKSKS
eukprot:s1069_g3.t1